MANQQQNNQTKPKPNKTNEQGVVPESTLNDLP